MKYLSGIYVLLMVSSLPVFASAAVADPFGIVTEIHGRPSLQRAGSKIDVQFGQELVAGDSLQTEGDDLLTFVAYSTCDEWTLAPMSTVRILDGAKISSVTGSTTRSAKLPTCYKPDEFVINQSNSTGGTILRSPLPQSTSQPANNAMEKLTLLADADQATNSELLSLIVFSLKNGYQLQAQRYASQLLSRNPNATLPKPLAQRLINSRP